MTNFAWMPLAFQMPGLTEWLVIGALGLLFFGKRLPEVGRSLGRGIVEFKKGLKGVEDEIDTAANTPSQPARLPADQAPTALPSTPAEKFDPYTGKPIAAAFDPYTGKPLNQTNVASR